MVGKPVHFGTTEEVEAWLQSGQGSQEQLRIKLSNKSLTGRSREVVQEWFAEKEASKKGFQALQDHRLRRREIQATEDAARAAEESARHAQDATRWARWAVVLAAVALVVSAWPYVEKLGRHLP